MSSFIAPVAKGTAERIFLMEFIGRMEAFASCEITNDQRACWVSLPRPECILDVRKNAQRWGEILKQISYPIYIPAFIEGLVIVNLSSGILWKISEETKVFRPFDWNQWDEDAVYVLEESSFGIWREDTRVRGILVDIHDPYAIAIKLLSKNFSHDEEKLQTRFFIPTTHLIALKVKPCPH